MADNTTLNTGAGGDTYASDDIGGVKFSRVKVVIGADGTNDGDVAAANPLPIAIVRNATVNSANSQVTASTSAATLAIARTTRRRLLAKNIDTTITVYVGAATVTSANGMPVLAGESVELRSQILYQVIAASGSPIVAIVDEYD